MQLSEHFTLEEMVASESADRLRIPNDPQPFIVQKLKFTAQCMERVRNLLGQPVHVNSGYRSPELNAAIGGAKDSQHMRGEACDFICASFGTPLEICRLIERNLTVLGVDQLIWEHTWVHCSFTEDREPRGEVLTYQNGIYAQGLPQGEQT